MKTIFCNSLQGSDELIGLVYSRKMSLKLLTTLQVLGVQRKEGWYCLQVMLLEICKVCFQTTIP